MVTANKTRCPDSTINIIALELAAIANLQHRLSKLTRSCNL